MKNASNLVKIGLASILSLTSCVDDSENFEKKGEFREFDAVVGIDAMGRRITLYDKESQFSEYIKARDFENDGRFDVIVLNSLSIGNPLEKYTYLDSLEIAYEEVMRK